MRTIIHTLAACLMVLLVAGAHAETDSGTPRQTYTAPATGYTGTGQKMLADDGKAHSFTGTMLSNVTVIVTNMAATTTDLFTIPSGQRGTVMTVATTTNATPGTLAYKVKIGGSYYLLNTPSTLTANTGSGVSPQSPYAFEAGETIAITTTQQGVTVFLNVDLFPTNTYFKTVHVLLTNGVNTVYTCPSGYGAFGITPYAQFALSQSLTMALTQTSGGPLTYTRSLNGIDMTSGLSVNSASASTQTLTPLSAGDVLTITSSSSDATQFAWFTLYEAPLP